MNIFRKGFGHGLYYETCGGYANQIHTAVYTNYEEEQVWYASNLEPYECECEECWNNGYENSTCNMKDYNMIEYLDESHADYKLYWIDLDYLLETNYFLMSKLSIHFNKEELEKAI